MARLKLAALLVGAFAAGCVYALFRPRAPRATDYHLPDGWRPQAD